MDESEDTSSPRGRARSETLAIPAEIRRAVDERDGGHCRVCGEFLGLEYRAQHHIEFGRGVGARRHHAVENLITVGWLPGQRPCHEIVHESKARYMGILLDIAAGRLGNVTALQVLRWNAKKPMASVPRGPVALTEEQVRDSFLRRTRSEKGCRVWTGACNTSGYGVLTSATLSRLRGKPAHFPIPATHAAFYFAHGRWPEQFLLHSCDNPPCVDVEHLREGTQAENMEDRKARRPRYGAANPASRHASAVPIIRQRRADGESVASIARDLGLTSGVVSRIARGINYPEGST